MLDGAISGRLVLKWLGIAIGLGLSFWLYRGYQPMMKHHPILGHLHLIGPLMQTLPSDCHGDYLLIMIQNNWKTLFPKCTKCPPLALIDMWPFTPPHLISLHPNVSAQFIQDVSRPKPPEQKRFLYPVTRNIDLSSYEEDVWKVWRKRFNPGFSPALITAKIPELLEEVEVFIDFLLKMAPTDGSWSDILQLEEKAIDLTFDVIGRYLLGVRIHEQTKGPTPLKDGLTDSLRRVRFYTNIGNIWLQLNPYRWFKFRSNRVKMDSVLMPILTSRVNHIATTRADQNQFLQLAVKSLQDEGPGKIDYEAFVLNALGHTKFFLWAGHDTTAATTCWMLWLLIRNPTALAKLRAELDSVLGPDAATSLRSSPHLSNSLVYTTAVIKESLRLQTNVGTMRHGGSDFTIYGPPDSEWAGQPFPTTDCVLWDGTWAIHQNPQFWHRADEFLPERWLVTDEKDPLYPGVKHSFRAFENGPRDCIGQFLAVTELKLVLAMVAREFEFAEDWEGWDAKRGGKKGGGKKKDVVFGERAYQIHELGTEGPPHFKDGFPVRVRRRVEKGV
ncbi:cytochrome P450 [Coniochaeta sp. 2T2.1]|nr:cytochrome P450 [Coniochaeta sp. 2T2.1]